MCLPPCTDTTRTSRIARGPFNDSLAKMSAAYEVKYTTDQDAAMRRNSATSCSLIILTLSKRRFAVSLSFRLKKRRICKLKRYKVLRAWVFWIHKIVFFAHTPRPHFSRIGARIESVSILWLACVAGYSIPRDAYLANDVSRHTYKPRYPRKLHRHGDTRVQNRWVPRLKARGALTFLDFIDTRMDRVGT